MPAARFSRTPEPARESSFLTNEARSGCAAAVTLVASTASTASEGRRTKDLNVMEAAYGWGMPLLREDGRLVSAVRLRFAQATPVAGPNRSSRSSLAAADPKSVEEG